MSTSPQIIIGLYREGSTDKRFFASLIQRTSDKSDRELGFDKNPEQISDPKAVITGAIRIASREKGKRHRNDLNISVLYERLGENISLESLGQLPSFQKFEDNVRNAFRELKYLN